MTKIDVPSPFGQGIVKKKWTDLRDSSDNQSSPMFRPWLTSKKPEKDKAVYGEEYDEYFKSKEECEQIIDRYKRIQEAFKAAAKDGEVDRLC
ncbi:hypothetical protein Sphch_0106 [Sphingobium chlorophenolicum L-1]|uniref:Uncharacterized protein n=1 Tax=Sphingobium chlorophenolicum L-1 TaxID=690566 RepID=F6EU01_SPHCR|nr:hypothetical protein [Sphingobium chlorophenolicum]AEG47808.1 hypothetical protein Sphch_0106 [Sphingobium chlorophenolicum L-1]